MNSLGVPYFKEGQSSTVLKSQKSGSHPWLVIFLNPTSSPVLRAENTIALSLTSFIPYDSLLMGPFMLKLNFVQVKKSFLLDYQKPPIWCINIQISLILINSPNWNCLQNDFSKIQMQSCCKSVKNTPIAPHRCENKTQATEAGLGGLSWSSLCYSPRLHDVILPLHTLNFLHTYRHHFC